MIRFNPLVGDLPSPFIEDFPVTFKFETEELRQQFLSWFSDGGGEQDFARGMEDDVGIDFSQQSDKEIIVTYIS